MTKPLIIGWDPSKPGEGCFNGATGKFLSKLIGCEDFHEYFDAVNLLRRPADSYDTDTRGARRIAEIAARRLIFSQLGKGDTRDFVLCGRDVQRAFDVKTNKWLGEPWSVEGDQCRLWAIPHPSGRCRVWNNQQMRQLTGMFLRSLI